MSKHRSVSAEAPNLALLISKIDELRASIERDRELGAKLAYDVGEASEKIGVSPRFLRTLIAEGRLRATRINKRVVITEEALREFLVRET
jgi:excisionase family DNA binding protein